MAGKLLQASGRGRSRFVRSSGVPVSEINITPFVDVILILLVVFMITAPMLTAGVPVDLPKASGKSLQAVKGEEPITITVGGTGGVFLGEKEVSLDELIPKLLERTAGKFNTRIYLRGDEAIAYGTVVEVMALLGGAGFQRIALVTKPQE